MVLIRETNDNRQSHKLHIFVEPAQCDRDPELGSIHVKPLCYNDPDTVLFRFYRIQIEVTDYAGNIGNTEATVIVLPESYNELAFFLNDYEINASKSVQL